MLRLSVLALSFVLLSCGGKSSSKNDAPKPSDDAGGMDDGNVDGDVDENNDGGEQNSPNEKLGTWYGLATKCLVDAEEVDISGLKTVKQSVICSPVISGKDRGEVNTKLDSWKADHCAQRVEVRLGTLGNFKGCYITPYAAQNALSNDNALIAAKVNDVELCQGKQGASYGSVRCN